MIIRCLDPSLRLPDPCSEILAVRLQVLGSGFRVFGLGISGLGILV